MSLHRKTLVLIHGHGVDDRIWDNLDASLNDNFTIVRPNISLFTFCRSIEDYGAELYRYLTNASIQKFTLIGHSMGGYIALAFAEKYPEMLEGFGLFHSTALADDEAKKHQRDQIIDLLNNHGTEAFLKHTAPNMFGERFKELFPEKLDAHIQQYSKLPATALIAGITAMRNRPDRTAVLAAMTFPVLFILGMQDKIIPFESGINLTDFPVKSYPFIFAEAGHMGMVERPDATTRMISWYMNKISSL